MAIATILSEQAVVESYQEIQHLAWFLTEIPPRSHSNSLIPHRLILQLLLYDVYDFLQFSM